MAPDHRTDGLKTTHVPTWRETGRWLTPAELDELTEAQRQQYLHESTVREVAEVDQMPEPARSTFRGLLDRLESDRQAS